MHRRNVQFAAIEKCLAEEVKRWASGVATLPRYAKVVCPVCANVVERRKAQAHATTHTIGKRSSLFRKGSEGRAKNPPHAQIIRALYDSDTVRGVVQGDYGARAHRLFADWLRDAVPAVDSTTLPNLIGRQGYNVELVFTERGPQYWLRDTVSQAGVKECGFYKNYTMGFANLFAQHLLRSMGLISPAIRTLMEELQRGGAEVAILMQGLKSPWSGRLYRSPTLKVQDECTTSAEAKCRSSAEEVQTHCHSPGMPVPFLHLIICPP